MKDPFSTIHEQKNMTEAVRTFCSKVRTEVRTSEKEDRTEDNFIRINNLQQSVKWVTVSEGANRLNIGERAFQKHCKLGHFVTRKVKMNGGFGYEISLESMIRYYREIGEVDKVLKLMGGDEITEKQLSFPNASNGNLLSEESLAKYQVVKMYEESVGEKNKVNSGKKFVRLFNEGSMPGLKEVLGEISLKSVYRWKRLLKDNNDNPGCFESGWNKNTGSTITTTESGLLIPMLLSPNQPLISEIINRFKSRLKEEGIEPKSDITYRRFIENWKRRNIDLWTLGRRGSKAFNDDILKSILRDKDRIEVGDILVADGHKMNVMVINPLTGRPQRMIIIMFYDFKSDMPVGWDIMPTENTSTIASALRGGILRLGKFFGAEGYVPKVVYLDNGRAFRGTFFTGVKDFRDSLIPGLFGKLGIDTMFATPYHGQSKPIERWFKTLGEMERRMPSYTGYNIESKPAMMMRNEKLHKRLFDNTAINIETLKVNLDLFIEEYATENHVGGFYKGYSPAEIFMNSIERIKEQGKYHDRLISKKELIYLMMSDKDRMISRNGIRFNGKYYWNEEMPSMIGSKVVIKYDIWNDEEVFVFTDKMKFMYSASKDDNLYHPAARLLGTAEDVRMLSDALAKKYAYKRRVESEFKAIVELAKVQGVDGLAKDGKRFPIEASGNDKREASVNGKKNAVMEYAKMLGYDKDYFFNPVKKILSK